MSIDPTNPMTAQAGQVFMGYTASGSDLEEDRSLCRICLNGQPTKEHIPPKSAFNNCDRLYSYFFRGANVKLDTVRSFRATGGYGVYSLCKSCNSGICAEYAKQYVELARQMAAQGPSAAGDLHSYFIEKVNLLYVMKQIASMILSVNSLAMAKAQEKLRHFVMNRAAKINMPFAIHLFHLPNTPEAGTITGFHGRCDPLRRGQPYGLLGGEIFGFPIGIVYSTEIGSEIVGQGLLNITHWSNMESDRASRSEYLTMQSLLTATDTFAGIHYGRNGKRQVEFTNGV